MKKNLLLVVCVLLSLPLFAENPVLRKAEFRILDIGNSYTNDATNLLPLIAKASETDLGTICLYRCYRSGGSFKKWVDIYYDNDKADTYSISKVLGGLPANVQIGTGKAGDGQLFREVLSNEKWDLIIIHPQGRYSPYYSIWNNDDAAGYLDELISIIKENQPNAIIGFLLVHSCWSEFETNTEKSSFERWELIAHSAKSFCEDYNVDIVIPYGTAIQNLRASSLNNEYDLTRDGMHCGYGLAQYTAACCYYESLIAPRSGISVLGNPARIDVSSKTSKYPVVNVTDENALIAQEAAYLATKDMYHCFNPESYIFKLIYEVDGELYKFLNVAFEMVISPEDEPTKDGYTFSGWSDIPKTMPARDVTITGAFTVNKYKLTYIVDGDEYKSYDVEYGSAITPESEPMKEGYTFSGWSEIPATMPAHDVIVTGSFTQTIYSVGDDTYEIIGEGTVTIKRSNQTGSVEISNTVEINGYTYLVTAIADNAFKDNSEIKSVTIENGIKAIGDKAFSGCVNLIAINIGKDVNTIGHKAFADIGTASFVRKRSNDASIITVNCYAESVPLSATDAFENTPIDTGLLLVEDSSVDAYKAASPWNGFGKIIGFEEAAGIQSTTIDTITNVTIYDIRGNRIEQLQRGVNIIRMNDGRTRKVVVGSRR